MQTRYAHDVQTWLVQGMVAAHCRQPRPDIRQAVVLVQFKTLTGIGWVAVGRSMRLVEERIINLTGLFAIAWSVTALASLVAFILFL